ncbi:MAG: 2Fe-2S iron-sulfur cluster-binding protein [Myxococcota bacterium]
MGDEGRRCVIRFLPSERQVEIEAGEMTLLDATLRAGLPIASACGSEGACARCGLEIVAGAESLEPESERERRIKARNRIDERQRLACRVRPTADLTVRASYW